MLWNKTGREVARVQAMKQKISAIRVLTCDCPHCSSKQNKFFMDLISVKLVDLQQQQHNLVYYI
jgi:hypothetical protein